MVFRKIGNIFVLNSGIKKVVFRGAYNSKKKMKNSQSKSRLIVERGFRDLIKRLLKISPGFALLSFCFYTFTNQLSAQGREKEIMLRNGWFIQSARVVTEPGEMISTLKYKPRNWYPATVPTTVLAALVACKVYSDPYPGMSLRSLPGMQYPVGDIFSRIPMPPESPFACSWWYRTEFSSESDPSNKTLWLAFDGINFRANVWLNGQRIADEWQVAGTYRNYEFNVSNMVSPGKVNVLAVEVFPPQPTDLQYNWVDVNPAPPDKDMGIWKPVKIKVTGPVAVRNVAVFSNLELPSMKTAQLKISADLKNATANTITGILKGEIETIKFEQTVEIKGNSTQRVTFSSKDFQQLNLSNPRVWWPAKLGVQNLYQAKLEFITDQQVSDLQNVQFGIREVSSELTAEGHRLFKINGKNILIRGAMWWPDMLLRSSPQRQEWELRYALDMNLNLLRMDGKFEDEHFLEMCDRYGMLLMPGWCCCDHWELWKDWDEEDTSIASASLTDQIRLFRNHPSMLTWLLADDVPPPPDVEKIYTAILKENDWPNPYQTHNGMESENARHTLSESTGYKMSGPYVWVPPSYWLTDRKKGGAFGFVTETSPTAAIPPVESLCKMLPSDSQWPIGDSWNFRSGGGVFRTQNIKVFTEALNARLGQARNIEDYALKAQLMAYEAQRAMFEAYGQNKYLSTGVVHEMLNNAWPSLIWNLYDYYLCPAGAYFGTKKACEPLHIQYAYNDHSIVVVNSLYEDFPGMKVTARVFDLNLNEKFSKEAMISVTSDASIKVFSIPEINGISTTYFILLKLESPKGEIVSSNFYWLSTKMDSIDLDKTEWYFTPTKSFADLTGLNDLKSASVRLTSKSVQSATGEDITHVKIENPSNNLAFFLRLRVSKGYGGEEVLPVLWQDNYFSLMPGEIREITAKYKHSDLNGRDPIVEVEGWNVKRTSK